MQLDSRPTPPPASWGSFLGAFALGIVVGAVGTVMHRSMRPWGLVICLVLVLTSAVAVRAWGGRRAWTGYAAALTATVWVLSTEGPGGDVLVPSGQNIGWVWMIGAPVVAVIVALLPAAVFDDRLRPVRGGASGGAVGPGGPLPSAGWPQPTATEPGWPQPTSGWPHPASAEPGGSRPASSDGAWSQQRPVDPGWPPTRPSGTAEPGAGPSAGGPSAGGPSA
ncbi:DUF6113 family protein [Cellulomonas alba]|uniref:DUF6113 family protein n=1 Tax=Cellulomonas alba TaxID=3053467 RepID=A0ABT7SHL4_9CELL|nr:DUF6113 family protein [Cellulomonas alba]MDM7855660.1 DUF6113 family protein [Cellulomonas alba]